MMRTNQKHPHYFQAHKRTDDIKCVQAVVSYLYSLLFSNLKMVHENSRIQAITAMRKLWHFF